MSATHGLPLAQLHSAGKRTIAGMVEKGWVEKQIDANMGERFRITPAGEAALKAKIPAER